jgi:ATP-dependent Clp protease adapter protein ClpS
MSTETETTVDIKIKAREDIPEPVDYNVIYINDEVTTQEFVSETLVLIFKWNNTICSIFSLFCGNFFQT